jgi:hypothetical protein
VLVPARRTIVCRVSARGKVKYGSTVHYALDDLHIDQHCTYYIIFHRYTIKSMETIHRYMT